MECEEWQRAVKSIPCIVLVIGLQFMTAWWAPMGSSTMGSYPPSQTVSLHWLTTDFSITLMISFSISLAYQSWLNVLYLVLHIKLPLLQECIHSTVRLENASQGCLYSTRILGCIIQRFYEQLGYFSHCLFWAQLGLESQHLKMEAATFFHCETAVCLPAVQCRW